MVELSYVAGPGSKLGRVKQWASETIDYEVDYSSWLQPGVFIVGSSSVSLPPEDLTIQTVGAGFDGQTATFRVAGGTNGRTYTIMATAMCSDGQALTSNLEVYVRLSDATPAPGTGTPGGNNGEVQYNNNGAFGGFPTTGTGSVVMSMSPELQGTVTISSGPGFQGPIGAAVPSSGKFKTASADPFLKGNVSGPITIDWRDGAVQVITLTGNTTITFAGWEAEPTFCKMTLIVLNTGDFTLTFPAHKTPAGLSLDVTPGPDAEDWYTVATRDAGVSTRILPTAMDFI